MKLVITGSAGLVGSELVPLLALQGHEIVEIDLSGTVSCDFRHWFSNETLRNVDGVVHLAAISRVAWGEARPDLCSSINIDGTRAIVTALLAQAKKPWILFSSSREVYGDPTALLVTEDDPRNPVNVYGRSKLSGEYLVEKFRSEGGRSAIIRLTSVYGGRRDHPDRAVPALIQRALSDQPLTLTGADQYFDFVHVTDVVDGLVRVIQQLEAGESQLPPIHLASGVATSLRRLAETALIVSASKAPIIEHAARSFDVRGFCGNTERALRLLGWATKIDLTEGAFQVARDLKTHGPLRAVQMPLG